MSSHVTIAAATPPTTQEREKRTKNPERMRIEEKHLLV
jgi:hypothetical protein